MHLTRVTCRTTGLTFSAPASTARWRLWECVLHSSGKTQNGVCFWVEDGKRSHSDAGWQLRGPALQPDGDQDLFRELRWITQTCSTSVLERSTCLVVSAWVISCGFSPSQLVCSSVMGTCGGDSGVLPWPLYAHLVWRGAPWSRASLRRVITWGRRWRKSEVSRGHKTKTANTHRVRCDRRLFSSGEPFDPVPLLNNAVANIICQIVFGRRFDYTNQLFQSMLHYLTELAYLEGSIWALVRHADTITGSHKFRTLWNSMQLFWKHFHLKHTRSLVFFSPNSCMTPSQHWWNTCQGLTIASSAAPDLWRHPSGQRWRGTSWIWTPATHEITSTPSWWKREYVANRKMISI